MSFRCHRYRCTHKQQLLVVLFCAFCWNISNFICLYTPNVADVQIFSSSPPSSEICQYIPGSKICSSGINSSSTAVSWDFPHSSGAQITAPSTEARYRHPNFTFDFPLCLVHVGKTAGSSISCGLGLMYADCEGMPRQPPLPHTDYFHMKKNNCLRFKEKVKGIATFLMTVRNPLLRIQSWFNFEKDILPTRRSKEVQERLRWKRGMLFKDCYDNFVDLVVNGLELPDSFVTTERPVNMTCRERAWAAILGVREFSYHEWYNYEHYWEGIKDFLRYNSTSSLLVLRTEHLSEDWSQLSKEELFRQVNKGSRTSSVSLPLLSSNVNNISSVFRSPKESVEATSTVIYSNRFWLNLCHAMCPEIKIYNQILNRANNINASQLNESISEIQVLCPQFYSTKEWNCPGIPQFPVLKVPRRRYRAETKKRLFTIG